MRPERYCQSRTVFCIKEGTAINFFVHNMPRLSVDIDLAYLPLLPRDLAIKDINAALHRIEFAIKNDFPHMKIHLDKVAETFPKMIINENRTLVKLEVNPIFRGCLLPTEVLPLCEKAQTLFQMDLDVQSLAIAELFSGKFCAALTRQHPRDLFDIKLFFDRFSLTDVFRQAFVVQLVCDRRPPHEIMMPRIKPFEVQEKIFRNEFMGMIDEMITYNELEGCIEKLLNAIKHGLTKNEKQFLLSVVAGEPEYGLMSIKNLENLSAIKWKLFNIKKMDTKKRELSCKALLDCF